MPDNASWRRLWASRRGRVGVALFLACGANFISFMIIGVCIGGFASAGKVADGQYFLGNKGVYTRASKELYVYSYWHLVSILASFPVAIVAWSLAAMAGEPDTKNPEPPPSDDPVVVTIDDPIK